MTHARRARRALLTSLGLLPLACGLGSKGDSGGISSDFEAKRERPSIPIAECGAGIPIFSTGTTSFNIGIGGPPQHDAVDTGLTRCESGVIHRPEPVACQSALPRPVPPVSGGDAGAPTLTQFEFLYPDATVFDEATSECSSDADCEAGPFGHCAPDYITGHPGEFARCYYGCQVDAECGAGFLCQCGDPVGQCIPADCVSDAECGGNKLCASWFTLNGCGEIEGHAFACQTTEDECATSADCADNGACAFEGGRRQCQPGLTGSCGRPFLVEDTARMASLVGAGDWARGDLRAVELGDPEEQHRVADYWARAGLMEHASIAAFARFALQLLHLGAPRELLAASQRAMQDETEHARLCFGLAERYLGATVGAGPLPMDGALLDLDFERIVVLCFREGCVGETVAALEARVARDHATDAQVRRALDRIAPDEESHAELAWKFIRWALRENPATTRAVLGRELRRLANQRSEPTARAATDPGVPEHGVLAERERSDIRRAALREVVLPCAEALLAAAGCSDAQRGSATELGQPTRPA
jgi:hypothetical protein